MTRGWWNRNTDGVNQGDHYDRIRKKIRAFRPKTVIELALLNNQTIMRA